MSRGVRRAPWSSCRGPGRRRRRTTGPGELESRVAVALDSARWGWDPPSLRFAPISQTKSGKDSGRDAPVRETRRAPVVTIASLYGAGASVIGRRVAERLGVPLLDRALLKDAARRSGVSEGTIAEVDEEPHSRKERLFFNLARATTVSSPQASTPDNVELQERRLRGAIEEALAGAKKSGGVAIGRGGMIVLRTVPWALHVRLGGPRDARIDQGTELEGIDYDAACRRQESEDKARIDYVRRAYGVDPWVTDLYHLILDSTAVPLDTCVELIVISARARLQQTSKIAPT